MQLHDGAWVAATVAALLATIISDTLYRRIPNALSLAVWLLGCSYWGAHQGMPGLWLALQGTLVGGGLLMLLYVMGTLGAGDVKVFAGFGALLGPEQALWAGLYGLVAGGVLSLIAIYVHRLSLADLRQGFAHLRLGAALQRARQRGTTVPLGVGLAIGVLFGAGFT